MTSRNCWKVTGPLPPRYPRVRGIPQTVVPGPAQISSLGLPRETGPLSGGCRHAPPLQLGRVRAGRAGTPRMCQGGLAEWDFAP